MRFVLNSKNRNNAAYYVCIKGLGDRLASLGHEVAYNNWDDYGRYDVAIFIAADAHCGYVRSSNPNILIGVADPKPSTLEQARDADFCIVSSIEQREAFLSINRNQFIYYMIPDFDAEPVVHTPKKLYRIIYHGNKVHLNGSYCGLIPALNELGKKHPIQFDVIYNIRELGLWTLGRPDNRVCRTRDLQWYTNCYREYFLDGDIGVVQNYIPWRSESFVRRVGKVSRSLLLEDPYDHWVKYKSSANAGRAFVFGYFGIPVVAEAIPSMSDAITDGFSGRLVMTPEGWYDALEDLIGSHESRQRLANNFRHTISERFAPEVSTRRLVEYISQLKVKPQIAIQPDAPGLLLETGRTMRDRFLNQVRRRVLRGPIK
jgi:hypothetical protein